MAPRDNEAERRLESILKERYFQLPQDEDERIRAAIIEVLGSYIGKRENTVTFLDKVAKMILRRFEFREVAIGLLDKKNMKYKYVISIGYTKTAQLTQLKAEFIYEDFFDNEKYPAIPIGRNSYFLTETPRKEDKAIYSQPSLLGKGRPSPESMIEGDYIDIFMWGDEKTLIGWLELSSPRSGNIPPRKVMNWLELIASIIARIVWERDYSAK